MSPRVSVIVPSQRWSQTLEMLLDALAKQTYRDFEVVVVDEDPSGEIASLSDPNRLGGPALQRVRVKGLGAFPKRCAGIESSAGEILAFTDSDCLPDRDWLEQGVSAIDAGAELVQGRTVPQRALGALEDSVSYAGRSGLFATCNVFYRRSAYDAAGGFDLHVGDRFGFRPTERARGRGFAEDTLLGWAIARSGRYTYLPGAVVRHDVVRLGAREVISREWMGGAFPSLFREVPELQSRLVRHGRFLGGIGPRILLYSAAVFALSALAPTPASAVLRTLAGLCLILWVSAWAWRSLRMFGALEDRVAAVGVNLVSDLTRSVALVFGSLRARKVVL